MLEISKGANPNYLAKIVKLKGLRKHSDADRLQVVDIDFQTVITGLEAKDGNLYVYFPVESKINPTFISHINGFRDNVKNMDPAKAGFFEDNCRVKALKLRGEKSMGFIVPIHELITFIGKPFPETGFLDVEFDTVAGIKLLEKYIIPIKEGSRPNKTGKKPKLSRLVEGQVHLHVDTENLRKNAYKIKPDDLVSISYKTHGTSWWAANVPVKRALSWWEAILVFFGVLIDRLEYDVVYGSRKVVKNEGVDPKGKDHYYGYDLWKDVMERVKDSIPKNYTLYGECIGFDKNGGYIQKDYDYGCKPNEFKAQIYRITVTNPDGTVTELSTPEIIEFCEKTGLETVSYYYYGKAKNVYPHIPTEEKEYWTKEFVTRLEKDYNGKDCFMCRNKVPEEGVVLRKEKLFGFEAYKLKSFEFVHRESKELDAGESDIESEN